MRVTHRDGRRPRNRRLSVGNGTACCVGVIGSLVTQADEEFRVHLPRLLHVSFLNFDSRNDLVYEQARLLVINLVHSLVAKHAGQTETYDRATAIIAQLTAKESTWAKLYHIQCRELAGALTPNAPTPLDVAR